LEKMTPRIEPYLPTEFVGLFLRYDVAPSVFLPAPIGSDAKYLSTKVLKYVLKYYLGTYLLVLKYFRKLVLSTYT